MIDGVKCNYHTSNPNTHLLGLPWEVYVIEETGDRINDERNLMLRSLYLALKPSSNSGYNFILNGSLHKYHNCGEHNTNDFPFRALQSTISGIASLFGIDANETALHGLEVGVNLPLPFPALRVINSIVCYRSKSFASIDPRIKRLGLICSLHDYEVKVYDKASQSGRDCGQVLRLEVKIKKMRYVESYNITTLADLQNLDKVKVLYTILSDVLNGIIWKDTAANLARMNQKERTQWHYLTNPASWQSMNKEQARTSRNKLAALLTRHQITTVKPQLDTLLLEAWNKLINQDFEAEKHPPFHRPRLKLEAVENPTFSQLEYSRKKWVPDTLNTNTSIAGSSSSLIPNNIIINCPKCGQKKCESCTDRINIQKKCRTCQRSLIGQKASSLFCSELVHGKKAKACRNKNSNRRRNLKRIIQKAMIHQNFIAVTYRLATGKSYTDTLHPSELLVTKEWLDKVEQINILPDTATDQPQTLIGQPAKEYLNSITSTNI